MDTNTITPHNSQHKIQPSFNRINHWNKGQESEITRKLVSYKLITKTCKQK